MNKLKKLNEQRAEQQRVMDELINSADSENRALTADEIAKFEAVEGVIKSEAQRGGSCHKGYR